MHNLMRFAKKRGFSLAQLNLMIRLHYRGDCGVSDLGEEAGVTSAAVSQLLEKMVQQGLVLRTEDPQDRRHKVIMLTEAGRQVVHEALTERQSWLMRLADLLTPEEQEQVDAALQLLIEKAALLDKS